jgi:transketolase
VEQIMSLRAIPELTDFHPADANETAAAWKLALERKSPSFMALSRQDLPVLDAAKYKVAEGVSKGGYVLEAGTDVVLVACGSEVTLAMKSAVELKAAGISAQVVSLPSWKIFDEQTTEYRESVLPKKLPKLAIEAGATLGWWKYADEVIGLDRFGASAPGPVAMDKLGFNVANVVEHAKKLIKK